MKNSLQVGAWCLYDWASAAFSVIVTTFIFATYFTSKIAENPILGTYQWANAASLAGILIAIFSPLIGAIADRGGHHKRWLFLFTFISILCTALLWFAYPKPDAVYFTLSCVVIGTIGLEIALVFYNSFLPQLAPSGYLGRLSGWGWGAGYLGGITALSIALFLFIHPNFNWLSNDSAARIRICGPFAALWYAFFSLPLFLLISDSPGTLLSIPKAIKAGCKSLWRTFKTLPQEKNIALYLLAHMVYTDGLNTLFAFGGIYAAGTFGLSFEEVLIFGITMNITAGLGALLLSWLDDYLGAKITILISLSFLILFGVPLLLIHDKYTFWIIALLLCLFVGPVQSASRSLIVRLLDTKGMTAEMFGLYALSGKLTAFVGPWLLGLLTFTFKSQRVGMATVILFFIFGALLLLPIEE